MDRQMDEAPQGRAAWLYGLIFMAAGSFIMAVAADVISVDPSTIHAPRWVLGAAGASFFLAGVLVASPCALRICAISWAPFS
jgi:hypothetical protein